jgi:hypothetical protein
MLIPALAALAKEETPRVFWAGYDTARLVLTAHWPKWTIPTRPMPSTPSGELTEEDERCTSPRKWINIWGEVVKEDWDLCWRAALSYIITRPGLTEVSLLRIRWINLG